MLAEVTTALRRDAQRADERRVLVLAGSAAAGYDGARAVLDAAGIPATGATLVGPEPTLDCEHLSIGHSGDLLGTTRAAVILDLHAECRPNALGRAVGAVDGGGLLVLLTPPLEEWPDRRDAFDETLAAPPADVADVTGHFRARLVETLRAHPGIAIVDVDAGTVERDGLTDSGPHRPDRTVTGPPDTTFPSSVYTACLTDDQSRAVHALEALQDDGQAVVVESDRGRGKSSACGFAAAALAMAGRDVLVTAPDYRNAATVFERVHETLDRNDALVRPPSDEPPRDLRTAEGRVRFERAADATALPGDPDAVIVDEAAALPVDVLDSFLDAPAVAFATTIHGYEGAGRGFSVRFRDRLTESDHEVTDAHLDDPIRYAAGDPDHLELHRASLPFPTRRSAALAADATPETVEYVTLSPTELLADENRLREVFGLLVLAHYRTEPDDVARLLDASNVSVRALVHDGHVVSVALLAREGGLDPETRAAMYDGCRIRGNMLPDVLTTQLRDEAAGTAVGMRVLRIATHHAARSQGLGSALLDAMRAEFAADVDWFGVGYGATPSLVDFWAANGYTPVHLSTTRNDTSGEYSALMLDPTSESGRALADRHADQLLARIGAVLADPLRDADADVVRAVLGALSREYDPGLTDWEWRQVASAAFGPGLFDMAPGPYRRLAVAYFVTDTDADLTDRQERLLVRKGLQGQPWDAVAAASSSPSTAECMRAFGTALEPLVDAFGNDAALTEADRYR